MFCSRSHCLHLLYALDICLYEISQRRWRCYCNIIMSIILAITHHRNYLQSIIRRRKGKDENSTSEPRNRTLEPRNSIPEPKTSTTDLKKSTSEALNDADQESYTILDTEDNSPEAVRWREKKTKIREVLSSNPLDLEALKDLAISNGGLVDGK